MRCRRSSRWMACVLSIVLFFSCIPCDSVSAKSSVSTVTVPDCSVTPVPAAELRTEALAASATVTEAATQLVSVTPTVTQVPTAAVTVTLGITATPVPTENVTPTVEGTPVPTMPPTESATPTLTLTSTATATPTATPTPTSTPTPTPSPTPTGPMKDGSTAYVNVADYLSVRKGPGTSYEKLTDAEGNLVQLTPGTLVTIVSHKKSTAGGIWYLVSFDYGAVSGMEGYVYGTYLQEYEYVEDPEFIAYLTQQGFPESYHKGLSILHSLNPQWVFEAQHTGLSWEDAVEGELPLGKNLVAKDSPSSWKSTVPGAYEWLNSEGADGGWVKFDGSNWDPASREIIEYYMDPRNFFSELAVFQFEHQSYNPLVHTAEGVQSLLNGTFMEGEVPDEDTTYLAVFMEAAEKSGVNPYMLVARCIQEMGTEGTSKIISGTVPGYLGLYNYFDIGAYTTAQNNLIINGLIYAGKTDETTLRPWNTRARSIIGGSIFLGSKYINVGQDTLYLQKFNVQGDYPYTHQYMSNVQAPANEAAIMHDAYTNLNMGLVFRIPVYEDMPEEKCARPVGDGNPNAYLKSLSVSNNELTPEFEYDTLSYDLVVSAGTAFVTIAYETIAATTTVTGGGKVELVHGTNTVPIVCTAENGDVITYTLNIYRVVTDETIETAYTIDNDWLRGVAPGTTVKEFFEKFVVTGSERVYFTDANGEEVVIRTEDVGGDTGDGSDIVVATGWTIHTDDQAYTLVVRGDVSGDGQITVFDMVYIRRQLLAISSLTEAQEQAALVSGGTEVGLLDMVYIRRHVLGIAAIPVQ